MPLDPGERIRRPSNSPGCRQPSYSAMPWLQQRRQAIAPPGCGSGRFPRLLAAEGIASAHDWCQTNSGASGGAGRPKRSCRRPSPTIAIRGVGRRELPTPRHRDVAETLVNSGAAQQTKAIASELGGCRAEWSCTEPPLRRQQAVDGAAEGGPNHRVHRRQCILNQVAEQGEPQGGVTARVRAGQRASAVC